jgi:hypothetical protein
MPSCQAHAFSDSKVTQTCLACQKAIIQGLQDQVVYWKNAWYEMRKIAGENAWLIPRQTFMQVLKDKVERFRHAHPKTKLIPLSQVAPLFPKQELGKNLDHLLSFMKEINWKCSEQEGVWYLHAP